MNGMGMPSREWIPADRAGAAFRPEAAARDTDAPKWFFDSVAKRTQLLRNDRRAI
jgi:hypothetical protein